MGIYNQDIHKLCMQCAYIIYHKQQTFIVLLYVLSLSKDLLIPKNYDELNFDGRHDGWPYKFLHRISDRAI